MSKAWINGDFIVEFSILWSIIKIKILIKKDSTKIETKKNPEGRGKPHLKYF